MIKTKARAKYRYSFARQFLEDHNVEIYRGKEQILKPIGTLYNIKLPNTRYFVGDLFIEHGSTVKITSYESIRDMGWCLISVPIQENERWVSNQKVKYLLIKLNEGLEHLGALPPQHLVELDNYSKQIRLIGPRAGAARIWSLGISGTATKKIS